MVCVPADPSSSTLAAEPDFVLCRERRFDAAPRRVKAPETDCLPRKSNLSVCAVVVVFVRFWKTVLPLKVWSDPSNVTVPVFAVNAPLFIQFPLNVIALLPAVMPPASILREPVRFKTEPSVYTPEPVFG